MRGCSTGGGEESELGGASFHLQPYRLPGRPQVPGQVRPIFFNFSSGNRRQLDISLWTDSVCRQQIIYHIIGNEGGGTPALQLPDGKGRRRGGENPAGGARGGRRCEGELRFFLQNANISSSSQSTRELWIGGRLHVHVPVFSREESESEKV